MLLPRQQYRLFVYGKRNRFMDGSIDHKSDFMCVLLYLLTLSATIVHRTRAYAGPCESRQRTARTDTPQSTIHVVQEMPICQGAIYSSE